LSGAEYLRIARVLGAHGLGGRIKILLVTDVQERFSVGGVVYLRQANEFRRHVVEEFLPYKKNVFLLRLDGIGVREAVDALRGCELFIPREDAEESRHLLGGDEFYYYDVIGCAVYRDGAPFGAVSGIMEAGAGEILVITDGTGREHLVPFVREMVNTDRLPERRIDITPVEGLLE